MDTKQARKLALNLLTQHKLSDWGFGWTASVKCFGICKYGPKKIFLSRRVTEINSEELVRDTILHEIAHALTPGDSHGTRWRLKCLEIGAKPVARFKRGDVNMPRGKYVYACTNCGKEIHKERQMKMVSLRYHVPCGTLEGKLVLQEINKRT